MKMVNGAVLLKSSVSDLSYYKGGSSIRPTQSEVKVYCSLNLYKRFFLSHSLSLGVGIGVRETFVWVEREVLVPSTPKIDLQILA